MLHPIFTWLLIFHSQHPPMWPPCCPRHRVVHRRAPVAGHRGVRGACDLRHGSGASASREKPVLKRVSCGLWQRMAKGLTLLRGLLLTLLWIFCYYEIVINIINIVCLTFLQRSLRGKQIPATAKDYFPQNEERFMIVSALQMMSTVGMLVAPVLGGVSGKLGGSFVGWCRMQIARV